MALAVGLSLIAVTTFGSVVGAGLPLLIRRLGLDPAVSSGPFIASLVDVLGIFLYLRIALAIMG
jgi:magnesium transporter